MKQMVVWIVPFFFFFQVQAIVLSDSCIHIPYHSCTFYKECLEQKFPCGENGYAVGYGDKYCQSFVKHENSFTKQGKIWLSDTMMCLQKALVPIIQDSITNQTCRTIRTFALHSHAQCYLQSGVCALPLNDWFLIARVIGLKQLITDLETIKVEAVVASNCTASIFQHMLHVLRTFDTLGPSLP